MRVRNCSLFNSIGRLLCVTVVAILSVSVSPTSAHAQPAKTIGQFCSTWNNVCKRVCTQSGMCGTCPSLHQGCLSSGCFNFRSGARCFNNPRDVELTDPKYAPSRRGR